MDEAPSEGWWARWRGVPLYLRIGGGLLLGVALGLAFGPRAPGLAIPSKLVLRLLGAIAPALVLFAIVQALLRTKLEGGAGGKLVRLLALNTLVAIAIGMLVANVLRPGQWSAGLHASGEGRGGPPDPGNLDVLSQLLDNVPRSLLGPLTDQGKVIGVILLALAFGLALRAHADRPLRNARDAVDVGLSALVGILHFIVDLVPFAVLGLVASIVGTQGFGPFRALGAFVVAVLVALGLQAVYYLTRVRFGSWVRPLALVRGCRDALVMAFSTASSTVTMPVTYECLTKNVGLRERSASLGALVGANFNNDGTALYEAMAALFVAQIVAGTGAGPALDAYQQLMVVLTAVVASVGAAGIPEAGLVTMTLVFNAVGLPTEYIALLLPVDWFLDRCRTAINVMGDMNVSCLLDGKRSLAAETAPG